MISTDELADNLHRITQGEILSYLNYTQILQLKAIIHNINEGTNHDKAD